MNLADMKQELNTALSLGDQNRTIIALMNLGVAYTSLGDHKASIDYYVSALVYFKVMGNLKGMSVALLAVGYAYLCLGEYIKAINGFRLALPILEKVGDVALYEQTSKMLELTYQALGI
jgi:tetratricopeptide (TPR) repeat protein